MKNKIFILFALILLANQLSTATNYNQNLMDILTSGRCFDAEQYYQQNEDSIAEPIRLYYQAEMSKAYNQPNAAIKYYNELIQKFFYSFPKDFAVGYILTPVMYCHEEVQDFAAAETLCKYMLDLCKSDTALYTPTIRQALIARCENNLKKISDSKQLPPNYIIEVDTAKQSTIPLEGDFQRIAFNAKWNNYSLKTIFDTGFFSCYIYNVETAEKIGVKINHHDTLTINSNSKAISGLLDSVELGNFKIRNIPVAINIHKPDSSSVSEQSCDSAINSMFDVVLGLPLIKRLGVTEINLEEKRISFFSKDTMTETNGIEQNIYLRNQALFLNLKANGQPISVFFDTGAVDFVMLHEYYDTHKDYMSVLNTMVKAGSFTGNCDSINSISINQYLCPEKLLVEINNRQVDITNKSFILSETPKNFLSYMLGGNDGLMGTCLFEGAKSVVFDFNSMIFKIVR
jgi:predicted aspartyl protease